MGFDLFLTFGLLKHPPLLEFTSRTYRILGILVQQNGIKECYKRVGFLSSYGIFHLDYFVYVHQESY